MSNRFLLSALGLATLTLAGCGGSDAPERGAMLSGPTVTANFAGPADMNAALAANPVTAQMMALAGEPRCGVRLTQIEYATVGGRGEDTNGSAAVMVPQGSDPACTGGRPVLLYGHGTTFERNFNIASPQNGEGAFLAAMFASQGYIVVAPNYAGYGISKLGYHPYLNAEQQSNDMIDGLRAARKSFAGLGAADSGKLFVSGYSQGGYVAMATARAMESASYRNEFKLTASGPMSGPYALSDMLKTVFSGGVNLGATGFTPMLMTSWQKAYGNLYTTPADMYEAPYAAGIEGLLPSTSSFNELVQTGKLPLALFASGPLVTGTAMDPVFALGIGTPNLVRQSYRQATLANPAHPMWAAASRNDLLNWTPTRPMALCYGAGDPVVFGTNTDSAMAYFGSRVTAGTVVRMNVEDPATVGAPLAGAFAQAKQGVAADPAASGGSPAEKVLLAYHGGLVPPFCGVAVRGFFSQVLASGA